MTPMAIKNKQLYEDRTVQGWHRWRFHESCHVIDVDLMGFCKDCGKPLYAIEGTTNTETKATRYVRSLAHCAGMHAILVYHDCHTVTGGRVIYSPDSQTITLADEEAVAEYIADIRRRHIAWHIARECRR